MSAEKLSRLLFAFSLLPLIGLPMLFIYFLIDITLFRTLAEQNLNYVIQWQSVTSTQLYLAAVISFLPHTLILWGVINLRRTLHAFMQSQIFNQQNILFMNRFALSLVLFALSSWIAKAIVSVVLSFNHPAGQKLLSIQIGSQHISVFLVGLVFWLIGKVMLHGFEIQQDNQSIV